MSDSTEETPNSQDILVIDVASKLREWALDEYIAAFEREQVDGEMLLSMPKDAVSEIIRPLGPRYKFFEKRDKELQLRNCSVAGKSVCQEKENVLVERPANNNVDPAGPSTTSQYGPGEKLRALLRKSVSGKCLLSRASLSNSDRNQITVIIIDDLLLKSLKVTKEDFELWSAEIVGLFPKERKGMYYVPYKGGERMSLASGKLWSRYGNVKKKLKKCGLNSSAPEKASPIAGENDDNAEEALVQLKSVALDDEYTIKTLWNRSSSLRNVQVDLAEYYTEYPVLKSPIGASLLQSDFARLKVADESALIAYWDKEAPAILQIAKSRAACRGILENTENNPPGIIAFQVLPYLFRPVKTKAGAKKKKFIPTLKEQGYGFILWIKDIANLQETLESRTEFLFKNGLNCQPVVVAVGPSENLEAAYVVINDMKYKFQSLLAAVDFCFKSFYALALDYPYESQMVWVFLQTYFYGIHCDKPFVATESLISDLKSISVVEKEPNPLERDSTESD